MTPDVSLKSIEFENTASAIGSVKVNLSNGVTSQRYMHQNFKSTPDEITVLEFDYDISIGAVSGLVLGVDHIRALKFYDREDQLQYKYSALRNEPWEYFEKFEIQDNQELIGIYGVANKKSWISNFGFIVKEKVSE